jgi:hypothetical protein
VDAVGPGIFLRRRRVLPVLFFGHDPRTAAILVADHVAKVTARKAINGVYVGKPMSLTIAEAERRCPPVHQSGLQRAAEQQIRLYTPFSFSGVRSEQNLA